jgi:hypothetical protein
MMFQMFSFVCKVTKNGLYSLPLPLYILGPDDEDGLNGICRIQIFSALGAAEKDDELRRKDSKEHGERVNRGITYRRGIVIGRVV